MDGRLLMVMDWREGGACLFAQQAGDASHLFTSLPGASSELKTLHTVCPVLPEPISRQRAKIVQLPSRIFMPPLFVLEAFCLYRPFHVMVGIRYCLSSQKVESLMC